MAGCKSKTMTVIGASFNGINLDLATKSSNFNLGGPVAGDGKMTVSGRYYATEEIMPSEANLSVIQNSDFSASDFSGCGDLIIVATTGKRYLITNARLSDLITYDDSKSETELKFKGDVGIEYS
jgi:hypothetical protein